MKPTLIERIESVIRFLIRRMCRANPLWGAPRIHGELFKLGLDISEVTVSKYMIKRCGSLSLGWRTYLAVPTNTNAFRFATDSNRAPFNLNCDGKRNDHNYPSRHNN